MCEVTIRGSEQRVWVQAWEAQGESGGAGSCGSGDC